MIEDTPLTRRRLLKVGGAAAAVASIPTFALPARAEAAGSWLTRSSYTGRIGEVFYMHLDKGSRFGMKLQSVNGSDHSFNLVFHPTSSVQHAQATRDFSHPALGRARLFVVPFRSPKSTLKYVVSVNRSH